jgi:perosamine synthetase
MNDIMAALGLAQLHRIDELNGRRKEIVKRYLKALKDEEWLQLPEWDENSSWHMMVVRCDNRNSFIDYLLSKGISAGVHYKPLYYYPMFDQTKLAVTEREWKRLVTLPLFPDLSDNETEYIIDSIIKYGRMN